MIKRPFAVLHCGQSWGRKYQVIEIEDFESFMFLLHLTLSDARSAQLPSVRTNFLKTKLYFL